MCSKQETDTAQSRNEFALRSADKPGWSGGRKRVRKKEKKSEEERERMNIGVGETLCKTRVVEEGGRA